jgi:hypothetical protein
MTAITQAIRKAIRRLLVLEALTERRTPVKNGFRKL